MHKAKDITPSIAWRRETWKEEALDDLSRKDERGPPSCSQKNTGTIPEAKLGKLLRDWVEGMYSLLRANRYHVEPN